jgi:hypothetical protein
MIDVHQWAEIRRLRFSEGLGIKAIVKHTGIARNTVRVPLPRRIRPRQPHRTPKTVYVREAEIVPRLDEWLAQLFEPDQLDETLEMLLASAQGQSAAEEARITAARRTLADCDAKLERYRAASKPAPIRRS